MTMLVAPSLERNLKVVTSTLTVTALILTVYRVTHRYAARRFWWEDACAVVALIGSITCVVASWLHFELAGQPSVISFWIYALTYIGVVWWVRLSVLLSIWRITSPSRNLRRVMILTAGLFILTWLSLMMIFVGKMKSDHPWYTIASQRDREGTHSVAIFELITDILSDCTLISLPIYLLRSVKLPCTQKRLIIAAFSSTILVTIVSFFRAACQVFSLSPLISVAIDIEVACALFVCNSLFITTLFYRMLRRKGGATDTNMNIPSSHSPCTPKETLQLTTIDLDALCSIFSGSISTDSSSITRPSAEKHCKDITADRYGQV